MMYCSRKFMGQLGASTNLCWLYCSQLAQASVCVHWMGCLGLVGLESTHPALLSLSSKQTIPRLIVMVKKEEVEMGKHFFMASAVSSLPLLHWQSKSHWKIGVLKESVVTERF